MKKLTNEEIQHLLKEDLANDGDADDAAVFKLLYAEFDKLKYDQLQSNGLQNAISELARQQEKTEMRSNFIAVILIIITGIAGLVGAILLLNEHLFKTIAYALTARPNLIFLAVVTWCLAGIADYKLRKFTSKKLTHFNEN
jgi:hypothetical protein